MTQPGIFPKMGPLFAAITRFIYLESFLEFVSVSWKRGLQLPMHPELPVLMENYPSRAKTIRFPLFFIIILLVVAFLGNGAFSADSALRFHTTKPGHRAGKKQSSQIDGYVVNRLCRCSFSHTSSFQLVEWNGVKPWKWCWLEDTIIKIENWRSLQTRGRAFGKKNAVCLRTLIMCCSNMFFLL